MQHPAEAVDVGVVQRRVHLVQHADGGRVGQEDAEDQRRRRQGLLAAAHQAHDRQALAGRASVDFQTGFQWVVALDQLQLGLTAAEEGLEQGLEVGVDDVEGRHQPLAALGVQFVDAVAQLGDRLGQVDAFGLHGAQTFAVFVGLFLGAQVDGAQGLAFALQPGQQALGAGGVARTGDGVVDQLLAQFVGRHLRRLADVGFRFGQTLRGGLGAGGQTGAGLARGPGGGLGGAAGAIAVARRAFGQRQGFG
ncbi:hypothetical protein D3C80_1129660 [compost metagenome]